MVAKTTQQFIATAMDVHGQKYQYTQTVYTKAHQPVTILCPIHGKFNQRANDHLNGAGCKQCAKIVRSNTCLKIYGTTFPMQNSDIQKKREQTCIARYGVNSPMKNLDTQAKRQKTCIERYGTAYPLQNQTIKDRLKQTCTERYNVKHYSQRHMVNIMNLLSDYDWLFDQYIIQQKSAIALADELGIWDTTIARYLHMHEIGIVQTYWHSTRCIEWLNSIATTENINIQHALNDGEYVIPNTKYKADGYCAKTNTIYEFHGDYWHGNPDVYTPDIFNEVAEKRMGDLYQATLKKEQTIIDLGYNLIVMWENDWNKLKRK